MKIPKLVECKSTGCHLPEECAREVDALVPTLPSECRTPRRKSAADLTATDPAERTDVSYISTPVVDHEKEVVLPDGLDTSVYDRNRIVLWQHDPSQPCGKNLWTKADGRGVLAKTLYPARPEKYDAAADWLPERIWGLVQADILKGKSITFLPLELADPSSEQKALGAEVVFSKTLLLEYSVVSIPCCPEAVVQAIEKGLAIDLLMRMERTGRMAKKRTKRTEIIDRTPEFFRAVERLKLDPDAIAAKVLAILQNRGRV